MYVWSHSSLWFKYNKDRIYGRLITPMKTIKIFQHTYRWTSIHTMLDDNKPDRRNWLGDPLLFWRCCGRGRRGRHGGRTRRRRRLRRQLLPSPDLVREVPAVRLRAHVDAELVPGHKWSHLLHICGHISGNTNKETNLALRSLPLSSRTLAKMAADTFSLSPMLDT